jgi:cell wall-associated NlpC family hydrolase
MNKSSIKKILLFLLSIIIFMMFYETKYDLLEKKIYHNDSLLVKYEGFKKQNLEQEINLSSQLISSVIDSAYTFLGTPNEIGGMDRKSIDASGLISMSLKKNGISKFPRIAQEMATYGKIIIDINNLKRGDLVFFFNTYPSKRLISSAGIYLGNNEFITSSSKLGVSIQKLDNPNYNYNYWKEHFFYGTRIFN